jgi:hypothetical protein
MTITNFSDNLLHVIFNPTHEIFNHLQEIFRVLAIRQIRRVSPGGHPAVDNVELGPKRLVLPEPFKTLRESQQ